MGISSVLGAIDVADAFLTVSSERLPLLQHVIRVGTIVWVECYQARGLDPKYGMGFFPLFEG